MNIGQAAERSGLSAKTIRYYEDIKLVVPQRQPGNGYRAYNQDDVKQLSFLQHARAVGFGLEECRHLLHLYRDASRQSGQVKQLVLEKILHLDQQLASMTAMRAALSEMARACAGDNAPDCAIIDNLTKPAAPTMSFTLVEAREK